MFPHNTIIDVINMQVTHFGQETEKLTYSQNNGFLLVSNDLYHVTHIVIGIAICKPSGCYLMATWEEYISRFRRSSNQVWHIHWLKRTVMLLRRFTITIIIRLFIQRQQMTSQTHSKLCFLSHITLWKFKLNKQHKSKYISANIR